ncbi:hypothetical protein IPC1130_12610 [Pseudomonas aeruginosa]|uniref:hypothetical protein n=1 Tax=Pseudomonas aeruginosa TaxID=287 RepID=UPI000FD2C5A8|nr:hypothetical protein [Pseudomonas aeruginosa]RUF60464.1 hypothetical protein IPC1130_12610 [Pseudomonas aeruginosa]
MSNVKRTEHIAQLRKQVAFHRAQAGFSYQRIYALEDENKALSEEVAALRRDKARLDAIEDNCWDVRYGSSSNADAGDSSISIEIVGHYLGAPHIRVLGENYTENLRAAIDQAMTAEAYPPERPEYDDHGRPLRALLSEQA